MFDTQTGFIVECVQFSGNWQRMADMSLAKRQLCLPKLVLFKNTHSKSINIYLPNALAALNRL